MSKVVPPKTQPANCCTMCSIYMNIKIFILKLVDISTVKIYKKKKKKKPRNLKNDQNINET